MGADNHTTAQVKAPEGFRNMVRETIENEIFAKEWRVMVKHDGVLTNTTGFVVGETEDEAQENAERYIRRVLEGVGFEYPEVGDYEVSVNRLIV